MHILGKVLGGHPHFCHLFTRPAKYFVKYAGPRHSSDAAVPICKECYDNIKKIEKGEYKKRNKWSARVIRIIGLSIEALNKFYSQTREEGNEKNIEDQISKRLEEEKRINK